MILWDTPLWIVLIFLFVLGSVIGSFLNVCIYRFPPHDGVWDAWKATTNPPSSCPKCKNHIRPQDNIPVFGWLKLGGRCYNCRSPISPRYMLIEFGNGLLWVVTYWLMIPAGWHDTLQQSCLYTPLSPILDMELSHFAIRWQLHLLYLYYMVLIEALVVATFIDFDLQIIPDGVTVPAMGVAFLGAALIGGTQLLPVWYQDVEFVDSLRLILPDWLAFFTGGPARFDWLKDHPHWHSIISSFAGFLVGGGIVWIIRILGAWVLRREAMGFGDVILMAMIGSFLGWQATLVIFFLAPLVALAVVIFTIITQREPEIPYGPYLSAAALIVLLGCRPVMTESSKLFAIGWLIVPLAVTMVITMGGLLWLVQGMKWVLGIELYPDETQAEWTSADQLAFFAGKNADSSFSNPTMSPTNSWPGIAAGQGRLFTDRWRSGRS